MAQFSWIISDCPSMVFDRSDPFAEFDLAKVAHVVFNRPAFSDLTIIVNGTPFYCHRDILTSASPFLQNSIDCQPKTKRAIVELDFPEIQFPDGFCCKEDHDSASWFKKYLRLLYGLSKPEPDDFIELIAMVQIADFLVSPSVLSLCDYLLSGASFDHENVFAMALFCEKYPLPETFQIVKETIAEDLYEVANNPQLYQISTKHFRDVVTLSICSHPWTFWIVLAYASGVVPENYVIRSKQLQIEDAEMGKFFRDLAKELSKNWTRLTVDAIFEDLENYEIVSGSAGRDEQLFLYKTISACYQRLLSERET